MQARYNSMHEYTCMHGTYKYMHVIAWYAYNNTGTMHAKYVAAWLDLCKT